MCSMVWHEQVPFGIRNCPIRTIHWNLSAAAGEHGYVVLGVELIIGRDELAFWNIAMKEVVEPARVTVWVGPSSVEGSQAYFEIDE